MTKRIDNYLRTRRREWGLSQKELSQLLCVRERSALGHYERGDLLPNFTAVIAYELLFGKRIRNLLPKATAAAEEAVVAAAYRLSQHLEGRPGSHVKRKLDLCDAILARATRRSKKRK